MERKHVWSRVREWLSGRVFRQVPRPRPVFVAQLYADDAQRLYERVAAFEEHTEASRLPSPRDEELEAPQQELAEAIRTLLLEAQHWRHVAQKSGATAPASPPYERLEERLGLLEESFADVVSGGDVGAYRLTLDAVLGEVREAHRETRVRSMAKR